MHAFVNTIGWIIFVYRPYSIPPIKSDVIVILFYFFISNKFKDNKNKNKKLTTALRAFIFEKILKTLWKKWKKKV